jgi:predicted CXXCH cytochrome family protein
MVDQTFNKNRVHWPLVDKVGCLNCHSPHASKQQKLLKGSISSVCGECHSDTVALQEWSRNNPKNQKLCEPVKKGNCISCHSPHAADNVLLISEVSISADLCGRCHEWQTHSTHPIGEKAIDQRNKNLTVECLSCHRACGTGNKPNMLTFDTTYELCVQCHVERRR